MTDQQDSQELFDEIAGKLEFDAGFSQQQAEATAQEIVKTQMQEIGGTRDFMVFRGFDLDGRSYPYRGYWLSMRPCPKCGKKMLTNGSEFVCLVCEGEKRSKD